MKTTAEAVIIGGGVMGCSILYNLALRGMKDLVLVEQDVLASGSTGRSQAILRMHYSNAITSAMAWESLKVYRDFEERVGNTSGFVETGYVVVVGPEDRRAIEQNVTMQRALGVDTSLVSPEDLEEVAPMLRVEDAGGLAYEPQSGYADPYQVTTGYARRARELGAEVHMKTTVSDVIIEADRVRGVVTSAGTIHCAKVVIATGPWSREFFHRLGLDVPLETVRHQVITFRRPEALLPSHPTVGDIAQEFSFRPDATDLTLAGIGEAPVKPDSYNQGVDMTAVEEASRKLVRRMPAMEQGYFRGGWSGLFVVTPDWHPILDRVEGIEGLYCAVGFSGHGFKLAPMIGVTMAELITEGRGRTLDISPFRMSRFKEGKLLRSRYRYSVLA